MFSILQNNPQLCEQYINELDSDSPVTKQEEISRKIIKGAHNDRIQSLITSGDSFISGSRDGHVRHWNWEGSFIKEDTKPAGLRSDLWVIVMQAISSGGVRP